MYLTKKISEETILGINPIGDCAYTKCIEAIQHILKGKEQVSAVSILETKGRDALFAYMEVSNEIDFDIFKRNKIVIEEKEINELDPINLHAEAKRQEYLCRLEMERLRRLAKNQTLLNA